ncbi:6809_t:CDS:1, partial [Racocetra persica]
DSQEFETAEPIFDQNLDVYYSNDFVIPFQDNDFEFYHHKAYLCMI